MMTTTSKKLRSKTKPNSLQARSWELRLEGKCLSEIGQMLNKTSYQVSQYLYLERIARNLPKYPWNNEPKCKIPLGNIFFPNSKKTEENNN